MIDVLTASTDPDLATTGDVMALMFGSTTTDAVNSTQEMDAIGRLIRRASAWAEQTVAYPLTLATYRETVPAFGERYLTVSNTPIVALKGLFDATDTGAAVDLTAEVVIEDRGAGLIARDRGFAWTNPTGFIGGTMSMGLTEAFRPGMEARPYLVEYVAGYVPLGGVSTDSLNYTTQATSTGSTIPEDLRYAITLKVLEMSANPLGVRSRRIGDLAVDYASAGPGGNRSAADDYLAPFMRVG